MVRVKKIAVMLCGMLLCLFANQASGQSTFNSKTTGGSWTSNGTWSGGSAPANWGSNTANVLGNVTVPGTLAGFTLITLQSGKTFTSGTSGTPQDLTLQSVTAFNVISGNITVYGNLTLTGATAMTITSGTLTVTGTLTITGGSSLVNNGSGLISVGALDVSGGTLNLAGNGTPTTGTGSLTSTGAVTLSGGSTITSSAAGTFTAPSFTSSGSGGTFNSNGTLSMSGAMSINSGTTVNLASSKTATIGSLSLSNNSDAILNNSGSLTVNGNVSQGGTFNNLSTGSIQINGNLTGSGSGSSVITNSGSLKATGSVSLPSSSKMNINPGGSTIIDGNVTIGSNENLVIGTSVAPPPYADMVIKGNLVQTGSGDLRIKQNGRFAIFGNVTDSGGGDSRFTVEDGGEVYVNGNINYTGGSSKITNSNTVSPYGLYVNGTTTNSGGGATTTSNEGNKTTMFTTNLPFYNWVASQPGSPLPVTLMYFKISSADENSVGLSWATASEKDFNYFSVERSADGKSFHEIGQVSGFGAVTAVKHEYSFQDNAPLSGTSYYRLKAVDLNGFFEYFKVISTSINASNKIELYPNPSNGDAVTLKLNFEPMSDARFEVFNNSGLRVGGGSVSAMDTSIDFARDLKPGSYLLHFTSSSKSTVVRFVVK